MCGKNLHHAGIVTKSSNFYYTVCMTEIKIHLSDQDASFLQ